MLVPKIVYGQRPNRVDGKAANGPFLIDQAFFTADCQQRERRPSYLYTAWYEFVKDGVRTSLRRISF